MFFNSLIGRFFSSKRKSQHKVSFFIYKLITKIYSKASFYLENLFFKKKFINNRFNKTGLFINKLKYNLNDFLEGTEENYLNNYLSIHELDKISLEKLLKIIFDEKTRKEISQITGFKYSLDYLRIYENKHIDRSSKELLVYREPHFDKAFSMNMLKIFIPLNVGPDSGALKVCHRNSKKYPKDYENKIDKSDYLIGYGDYMYGFSPNICWHQEGNPNKGYSAKQIMIQLNPSTEWQFRNDLYLRQLCPENKFPSFTSLFAKTSKIDDL